MTATLTIPAPAREFRVPAGASIQPALDAVVVNGGKVVLEAGSHDVDTPLTLDLTSHAFDDLDTVSITGAGAGLTELNGTAGSGSILTINGSSSLNLNSTIRGVKFTGAGMTGLTVDTGAFLSLEDVLFYNLERGMDTVDFLTSAFWNVRWQTNNYGLRVQASSGVSPGNALTFHGCKFMGNRENGLTATSASLLSFYGGNIEGNGHSGDDTDRYGVKLVTPNQGIVAVNLFGVWFENNANTADIWVDMGSLPAIVNAVGCTFLRVDSDSSKWSTSNIRLDSSALEEQVTLNTGGCSFRGAGTYSPNAARPYIAFNTSGLGVRWTHPGTYFASATELPDHESGEILASCTFNGTLASPVANTPNNVTTITKNGTGDYTLTLPLDLRSTHNVSVGLNGAGVGFLAAQSAGSIRLNTVNLSGTATDFSVVAVRVIA